MAVKFSRSGLRRLMESISASIDDDPEIRRAFMGDEPEMYGPPTEKEMKEIARAKAHNDKIVAAFRESLLDNMPNIDHNR